jgi:hypothetical protein
MVRIEDDRFPRSDRARSRASTLFLGVVLCCFLGGGSLERGGGRLSLSRRLIRRHLRAPGRIARCA